MAEGACPLGSKPRTADLRQWLQPRPFGEVQNVHSDPHLPGVLWYGANGVCALPPLFTRLFDREPSLVEKPGPFAFLPR